VRLAAILLLAPIGCHQPALQPPSWRATPDVDVQAPWQVVQQDDDVIALRFNDTPHGVRVFLGPSDRSHQAGASPVVDGRTVGRPMLGVPHAIGPARTVKVRSDGYDLLVRFASQPLDEVSHDALAPADPALTWLRLRPRNDSWRIVMDGLGTLTLPADGAHPSTAGTALSGPAGTMDVETDAPVVSTTWTDGVWQLSTLPSVEARVPYPRTAFTWTPDGADD
jgi:hypothetical protein